MSGIFGIIDFVPHQAFDKQYFIKSLQSLKHRGTDGITSKNLLNANFTYFHINTTYTSFLENQPLLNSNRMLVADLRLDNRNELLLELDLDNEASDSDLVLEAFSKWGEDCFEKLIGDFAIAIYDSTINKIYLVRDYSGVRNLYYTFFENKLVFASELKALLNLPNFEAEPNPNRIKDYLAIPGLACGYEKETFYKNIFQVLPAHIFTYEKFKNTETCFWDLKKSKYSHLDELELLTEFKSVFHQTIKSRTDSPYNVASFMSGGIDSSSVTVIANEYCVKNKLFTYFWKPSVANSYEEQKVKDFITQTKLPCFMAETGTKLIENSKKACNIIDMPDKYPIRFNTLKRIFEEIEGDECRILLTGTDGDTVIGMGNKVFENALSSNNKRLFIKYLNEKFNLNEQELLSEFKNEQYEYYSKIFMVTLGAAIKHYGKLKGIFWTMKTLLNAKLLNFNGIAYYLTNKFKNRKENETIKNHVFRNKPTSETGKLLFENGNFIQLSTVRQEFLNNVASNFQVEVSHPILDKRLIEICYYLSPETKFWQGKTRGPLRFVTQHLLPASYQDSKTKSNNDYLISFQKETFQDTKALTKFFEENKELVNSLSIKYNTYNFEKLKNELETLPFYKVNEITQLVLWLKNIKQSKQNN